MTRIEKNLSRAAVALALVGALAAMASLESLEQQRPAPTQVAMATPGAPAVRVCQARIGERLVQVPVGSGIQVDGKWRSCELYDGHPVMVHSAERPQAAL